MKIKKPVYNHTNDNHFSVPLPEHLHNILIGFMLGDGGIYTVGRNSRLEFSMGSKNKDYAIFMAELFKKYASNPLKCICVVNRGGKEFLSDRFQLRSNFKLLRN
jgi:hypothetical protein